MHKSKLDKTFLLIVSIQTILMGIFFIVQILRIYYGNEHIFTRDICGKYLLQILPVIIIWVLVVIASFIYFYIKNHPQKDVAKITNITKLNSLMTICPEFVNENLDEEYSLIKKENKNRKIAKVINIIIVILCSLMGLGYLINIEHFDASGDLTQQAIDMGIHLLPWCIISFASLIFTTLYEEYSAKKEIELVKKIIKTDGKKPKSLYNKNKNKAINIARLSILALSVLLIVVGVFNGGAEDVLQKAINICTECIGLG